jgi:hypothetical protein
MGIQNVSSRVIIFILLLGVSTITYFIANQDRYVPNDQLYVEYTEQDILDMQLDYTLSDLNDHTLDEVFGQGNLLDSEQLVTNGGVDTNVTGWDKSNSTNEWLTGGYLRNTATGGVASGITYTPTCAMVSGNIYYFKTRARVTNTLATGILISGISTTPAGSTSFVPAQNIWYEFGDIFTSTLTSTRIPFGIGHYYANITDATGAVMEVDYAYAFNISTLIGNKQYSPLYNTTFDLMSDAQIKAQMDLWVQNPQYWLDYDQLGIYLTQDELEEYYQMYLDILDGERVIDLALGTIDMNGKDYYHLSVSDYEDLGNNGVVDFKYLFSENGPLLSVSKTLKVVKNFIEKGIESFGNFIDGYVSLMQKIKDFLIWLQ